ncbi:MAG TPA: class I SAM-dependent methyltransferase [Gemmataceae bacterium]
MSEFYDRLAPFYHLIYPDWEASVARQAEQLAAVIRGRWGGARTVLDVSCGIGTQAIGLAAAGFAVTGSDLSARGVERARREAAARGLDIPFSVCDMRAASRHHRGPFDVVLSCDNSVPHLLTDADILAALREMFACARPGGGCLLSVRDYDREPRGAGIVRPYGVREEAGKRYLVFQVWDFDGACYDLAMYFVEDDRAGGTARTHVMRSRYYAIGTGRLLELMREAGFADVERLDGVFYQPVLVGTRKEG